VSAVPCLNQMGLSHLGFQRTVVQRVSVSYGNNTELKTDGVRERCSTIVAVRGRFDQAFCSPSVLAGCLHLSQHAPRFTRMLAYQETLLDDGLSAAPVSAQGRNTRGTRTIVLIVNDMILHNLISLVRYTRVEGRP